MYALSRLVVWMFGCLVVWLVGWWVGGLVEGESFMLSENHSLDAAHFPRQGVVVPTHILYSTYDICMREGQNLN